MSSDRPRGLNGFPVLEREAPDLPRFEGRQPTLYELLVAYATMAAAFHQRWPQVVDALEWLKVHYAPRTDPAPPPAVDPDDSAEIVDGLERVEAAVDKVGEFLKEITDTQVMRISEENRLDSERVRAIWKEENLRAIQANAAAELQAQAAEARSIKAVKAAERAKLPMKVAIAVLSALLAGAVSLLLWHITKTHP